MQANSFSGDHMIGRKNREQRTLFIAGDIEQFIPEDHILKRVERILDLNWLREEVRECYCEDNGRPGIDPEAVRLWRNACRVFSWDSA
jgi:hypothetical protein